MLEVGWGAETREIPAHPTNATREAASHDVTEYLRNSYVVAIARSSARFGRTIGIRDVIECM